MYVHGYLLNLVIFDINNEVVLEPAAGVVEHRYQYPLALLLVEGAACWLAQHADSLVVAQVHLLRSVQRLAPDKRLPHLRRKRLLLDLHQTLVTLPLKVAALLKRAEVLSVDLVFSGEA